jgi:hypothetical protein
MPNISIYLSNETLEVVRAKSKAEKIPLSTIIREAVEQYLNTSESKKARKYVFKTLIGKRPLGEWEELHEERTLADAHRG